MISQKSPVLVGARGDTRRQPAVRWAADPVAVYPAPQVLTVPWPDGTRGTDNPPQNGAAYREQYRGTTPEQDRPIPPQAECRRGPAPDGGLRGLLNLLRTADTGH